MDVAQLDNGEPFERRLQVFDRDLHPFHDRRIGFVIQLDLPYPGQQPPGRKKTAYLHKFPAIHRKFLGC